MVPLKSTTPIDQESRIDRWDYQANKIPPSDIGNLIDLILDH